jgi:hypothetical protein
MHSQSAKARWKINISIRGKWKSRRCCFSRFAALEGSWLIRTEKSRLKAQSDKLASQSKSTPGEKKKK